MAAVGEVQPNAGPYNITSGTVLRGANITRTQFVNSGTPAGVALAADCGLRWLAWEFGLKLRPDRDPPQLAACKPNPKR